MLVIAQFYFLKLILFLCLFKLIMSIINSQLKLSERGFSLQLNLVCKNLHLSQFIFKYPNLQMMNFLI